MTPVLLDRDRVEQRVHRIEDDQVRSPEEFDEARRFVLVFGSVLGVGRVHDRASAAVEAAAVRVTGVALRLEFQRGAADGLRTSGLESHELDACGEPVEVHGETRCRLLQAQRVFHHGMSAVDADGPVGS